MIKFIVILLLLLFVANCSYNKVYISSQNTPNDNHKASYTFNGLSNKKILNLKQITYLKNIIKNDPTLIKQLSPYQVENLLGTPRIIKKQPFFEIWQYKNSCILNIIWETDNSKEYLKKFLYTPTNINYNYLKFKIVWIEALTTNKQKLSPSACFFQLANIPSNN